MNKLVAALSSIHAPPTWVWLLGIAGLTAAVWYYTEINPG